MLFDLSQEHVQRSLLIPVYELSITALDTTPCSSIDIASDNSWKDQYQIQISRAAHKRGKRWINISLHDAR